MKRGINEFLNIYLGSDGTGGFQPIGCEDRLQQAFPNGHERVREMIRPYLEMDYSPDWSKNDLAKEGELFATALRKQFPELDEDVVLTLANRFKFDWK